jgi:predicted lipid-binding transport protein (Tim44 family)
MITILTWLLAIIAAIVGVIIIFAIGGTVLGVAGVILFILLDLLIASLPFILMVAIANFIKKKKEKDEDEDSE